MPIDLKRITADLQAGRQQFDFSPYPLSAKELIVVAKLIAESGRVTHLSFAAEFTAVWQTHAGDWIFNPLLQTALANALMCNAGSLVFLDLSRCQFAFNAFSIIEPPRFARTARWQRKIIPDGNADVEEVFPLTTSILRCTNLCYLNLSNSFFTTDDLEKIIELKVDNFVCQNYQFLDLSTPQDKRQEVALKLLKATSTLKLAANQQDETDEAEITAEELTTTSEQCYANSWAKHSKNWQPKIGTGKDEFSLWLAHDLMAVKLTNPSRRERADRYRLIIVLLLQAKQQQEASGLLNKAIQGFLSPEEKASLEEAKVPLPEDAKKPVRLKLVRLIELKELINTKILELRQEQILNAGNASQLQKYTTAQLGFITETQSFFTYLSELLPQEVTQIQQIPALKDSYQTFVLAQQQLEENWPLSFLLALQEKFERLTLEELHNACQHPILKSLLKEKLGRDEILLYEELLLSEPEQTSNRIYLNDGTFEILLYKVNSSDGASTSRALPSTSTSLDTKLTISQLEQAYVVRAASLFASFRAVLAKDSKEAIQKRKDKFFQELKEQNYDPLTFARVAAIYNGALKDQVEEEVFIDYVLKEQKSDPDFFKEVLDIYSFPLSVKQRTILLVILSDRAQLGKEFVATIFNIYLDRQLQQFFWPCFYGAVACCLHSLEIEAQRRTLDVFESVMEIADGEDSDPIAFFSQLASESLEISKDDQEILALLEKSARNNWQPIINKLVALQVDITQPLPSGRTVLHVATEAGHAELTQFLFPHFQAGGIHARDYAGMTALHLAFLAGQQPIVLRLCLAGADLNIKAIDGNKGMNLLDKKTQATYQGLEKLIKMLQFYRMGLFQRARYCLTLALRASTTINFSKSAKQMLQKLIPVG